MKNNDDIFDEIIKQRLKSEIQDIPNNINKLFDEQDSKLKKHKHIYKKVAAGFIIGLCGLTVFGITMPTYAQSIPILGKIVDIFKSSRYENYDKYSSDLNISKESSNLKMTVTKVVYDEINLSIFYTIESEDKLKSRPIFPSAELKINDKETTFSAGGGGSFSNDNKTYIGVIEYHVEKNNEIPKDLLDEILFGGSVEIPDNFKLSLNIDEILTGDNSEIKGNWNFDIPVTNEKVAGNIKKSNCDVDLSEVVDGYKINKIITTPLNTQLQSSSLNSREDSNILFCAIDNKGRYLPLKSADSIGKQGKMYNTIDFKEVYNDTESITFVPYKWVNIKIYSEEGNEEINDDRKRITSKLNLNGETKLNSSNGEEYITITKVESGNGKTKIYYKSKYSVQVLPFGITDNKTKEKILDISSEGESQVSQQDSISYLKDSDEFVFTLDKELKDDDYSIEVIDKSNSIKVYNDLAFTIDVK